MGFDGEERERLGLGKGNVCDSHEGDRREGRNVLGEGYRKNILSEVQGAKERFWRL